VAWSPDGTRIATASWDRTVQVWEAATGKQVWPYNPTYPMCTAEWSPDGRYLATGGDGAVQVWTIAGWRSIFTYTSSGYPAIYASSWSPDSKRLAAALQDGTAQVWDALTGKHVLIYRGHVGQVIDVAWSPNGKYVASSGVDKKVQVWESSTGSLIFTYYGHLDRVDQLGWSPDGKRLASGSKDDTVQICRAG
jgi:WD40 repeat protein